MAFSKKNRSRLWFCLLLLFLFGVGLETTFRTYGLPDYFRGLVEDRLANSGLNGRIAWVKASLFSGVTLSGVVLKADTPIGPLCLQAREISTGVNIIELLRRRFALDNFKVSGAKLLLLTPSGVDTLQAEKIVFMAGRQGINNLSANIFFSLRGIRIRGEFVLENCPDFAQILASLTSSSGELSAAQLAKISSTMESALRLLQKCEFGNNDASISFSTHSDCENFAATTVQGDFDLNYSRIGEILVNKQRGKFHYANQRLNFENLHWLLNNDERLSASLIFDLAKQTVAAKFHGRLIPSTALSLANPWSIVWPNFLSCPLPIAFQGELPATPWDLSQATPFLQGSIKSLSIFGSTLPKTTFTLRVEEQNIILEKLLLSFDYYNNRFIEGNLKWNYARQLLSGDLSARLNIKELLTNHGLSSSDTVLSFSDWDDAWLAIKLQESPLVLNKLKLNGWLSERHWREYNCSIYSLHLPFSLDNGILSIDGGTAGIDNPLHDNLEFSASLNLPTALSGQKFNTSFSLKLLSRSGEEEADDDSDDDDGLVSGLCEIDWSNGSLAFPEGYGFVLPEHFLAEFPRLGKIIPLQLATVFSCPQPIQFQFSVPSFLWNKPQTGKILLHCLGTEITFNGLDIHTVSTDAEITLQDTRFLNIRGLINDDEMVSLDLLLKHSPLALNISNALIQGKPNFIESFIFSSTALEIYQAIWQDVSWSQEYLPIIYIPSLIYYEDSLNANNWTLSMDCDLSISNAAYKSFPIPQADVSLRLELPDELSIAPIVLNTQNGDIKARVKCVFSSNPHCVFAVEETECSPDTILLLQVIAEDWGDFLANFTLHEQSKIRCAGTISFASPPEVSISGTLKAPECTFQKFHLQDLSARWSYSNERLFWDVFEAQFLSAKLLTTGLFDFRSHSGETLLEFRDLPLQKAHDLFYPAEDAGESVKLLGLLNCNCKLKLLQNWAGRPIYLEGAGHLTLREADLWRVPLMGSLSSILSLGTFNLFARDSVSSLGTISELAADFDLKGTRVVVPSFDTNGTFVSLFGSGEYSWESDNLHFRVQGQAMKNVNILSFMLKPLSWAFDAELLGTSKKPEWKIRNPLSKVFSTD